MPVDNLPGLGGETVGLGIGGIIAGIVIVIKRYLSNNNTEQNEDNRTEDRRNNDIIRREEDRRIILQHFDTTLKQELSEFRVDMILQLGEFKSIIRNDVHRLENIIESLRK